MRIKKYIASSLQEGKARILKELGEDAVILSSRTIKKGDSASDDVIEIVAALDDIASQAANSYPPQPRLEKQYSVPQQQLPPDSVTNEFREFNATASHIHDEISVLRNKLDEISDSIRFKYSGILGPVAGSLYKSLRTSGFSENFSMNLIGSLNIKGMPPNIEEAFFEARKEISSRLSVMPTISKSDKRKVFAFVGSTGTGKTTTLIKLAIISKLILGSNSLVISADVHKVGGVEQLQTFASIAGLAFRAVYSPDELGDILKDEKDRDFVFIDTTGRSQQNKEHLNEINDFLAAATPDMIYLVQSLTSSSRNFAQVLDVYDRFNPDALILTKSDEAVSSGEFFEVLFKSRLPVAYLTNGQQIPNDIEPADLKLLGDLALDHSQPVN